MEFKSKEQNTLLCITGVMEDFKGQNLINEETALDEIDNILEEYYKENEMDINELVNLVEKWSIDKRLDEADSSKQFLKVAEEFGEIGAALARGNGEDFKDAVGDTIVTLIILAQQNGTNVKECLEVAYDEIKGRKGKTINGVFIKESDL